MSEVNESAGKKTLWQLVKYLMVSCMVSIIQLTLGYLLPFVFDSVTATLPDFLAGIFKPEVMFDLSTAAGEKSYSKYVVDGVITWGYLLPFFLSNLLANIFGFFQNRKTTFKSGAPKRNVIIFVDVFCCLMLFTTWIQGLVFAACTHVDSALLNGASRLIAMAVAGTIQFAVNFPMEKFWLLKE